MLLETRISDAAVIKDTKFGMGCYLILWLNSLLKEI